MEDAGGRRWASPAPETPTSQRPSENQHDAVLVAATAGRRQRALRHSWAHRPERLGACDVLGPISVLKENEIFALREDPHITLEFFNV